MGARQGEPEAAEQQQLINRILSSREFAHAHIQKRILRYLFERSADEPAAPPKEYDIATQAMGRPPSFDPRTDPIVRVSIGSIRDRLLAYFATEGKTERLRLHIPKGQYLAVFTAADANDPAGPELPRATALARFWKPYLSGAAANLIVYTEPLFFRDNSGHYIRDWRVNDVNGGERQLREGLPLNGIGELTPSFHYLSAGEVHCLLSLSRMFHEMKTRVETRNSRISSWNELRNCNLVLLGSPRTNTFLEALLGDEDFTIDSERILNRAPRPGEKSEYRGRRYLDGKLMRMTEHAVVMRRPGLSPGATITVIAANHGRAIEGAGHLLTLEDQVQQIIRNLFPAYPECLPESFQLLMQVETIDVDDEVAEVRPIAHRIASE